VSKSKVVREPIATWWKIETYPVEIQPVKVVAFSDRFVTFFSPYWKSEQRRCRDDYFPTFAEAKEEYTRRLQLRIVLQREKLEIDEENLASVQALKQPEADNA
jgi:hypothetical protein